VRYVVRCQSASGQVVDVHVLAGTECAACNVALRQLDKALQFQAIYALEA
jgi:hypothetical protein